MSGARLGSGQTGHGEACPFKESGESALEVGCDDGDTEVSCCPGPSLTAGRAALRPVCAQPGCSVWGSGRAGG